MHIASRLLACSLLLLGFTGMAQGPGLLVRFFVEANAQDTERFATPLEVHNPPRSIYVERVPTVSERNIKGMFPFRAPDGTWGCAFQLDPSGRLSLYTISNENRGRTIVA